jgi:transposase, IS5 family
VEQDSEPTASVRDFESPPGPSGPESPEVLAPGVASGSEDDSTHRGILKADATVCDQYVKYPTDWDLVNRCRRESERLIDILCKKLRLSVKPRTHRKKAQEEYLGVVKNKKKRRSNRERRVLIGKQLRYLRRNLGHIDRLLDRFDRIPFKRRDYKISMVIRHICQQQTEMWRNKVNRCEDRIVSIYQPHVRPVVRGKAGKNVEFGSKIAISLDDGFARIDFFGWDAFNEGGLLIQQVHFYKDQHGCWPQKVVADQIYGTLENRNYLKKIGVQFQVKPLGRPAKTPKKIKEKLITRNDLEGKFGEGKNGFNLHEIRATRSDTSKSWIAAIFFVMNINEAFRRTAHWLLLFKTLITARCSATQAHRRSHAHSIVRQIQNSGRRGRLFQQTLLT